MRFINILGFAVITNTQCWSSRTSVHHLKAFWISRKVSDSRGYDYMEGGMFFLFWKISGGYGYLGGYVYYFLPWRPGGTFNWEGTFIWNCIVHKSYGSRVTLWAHTMPLECYLLQTGRDLSFTMRYYTTLYVKRLQNCRPSNFEDVWTVQESNLGVSIQNSTHIHSCWTQALWTANFCRSSKFDGL